MPLQLGELPETKFLKNTWYMAGWATEFGETPLRRVLLGSAIMFYRAGDGKVVAMEDRCPHRFAPLSKGQRQGDNIECAYHGLVFDRHGTCVLNPFADSPPKGAAVRTWAVHEQDGILWLWAGSPGTADLGAVPDYSDVRCPTGLPLITGYQQTRANYQFVTDNLMDLSHIEFVHRGTFGTDGMLFKGKHTLEQLEDGGLRSEWAMSDYAPPGWGYWLYSPGQSTDQWLIMRWQAPATMKLDIGVTAHGAARADGFTVRQAHILTPETEHTTHYFWGTGRFGFEQSAEIDQIVHDRQIAAFDIQDKPIIEAAYANIGGGDFWAQKPIFMGVDAGSTTARRIVEKKIAEANKAG